MTDKSRDKTKDKRQEPYNKRNDPNYTQVSGLIPGVLKRQFKAKVALEGDDMSQVLEALIQAYVEAK